MRVLVDGLSVRGLSGEHVLLGHLRQLGKWTVGQSTFFLLHDSTQTGWIRDLPANVEPVTIPGSVAGWWRRVFWQTRVLPRMLKTLAVDVVLTTSGALLPRCSVPQVCYAQNPWCLVPRVHKGPAQRTKARLQRWAYHRAMRKVDMMLYISRHLRDLYRQGAADAVERASQIVYTAIDDSAHDAAQAAQDAVVKRPDLIVAVSAMAPWKGIDVLVEALAVLHRNGCRARLRLVGPWPDRLYEALVRSRITALGLEDFVTITGKVSKAELYRHYAEANVFCLMSECESFGIPAVEAQAFGSPVVGSNSCAMPEICGDGGLFGPPQDPTRTAELLGGLLEDRHRWQDLSDRARRNAGQYRWEDCSGPLWNALTVAASGQSRSCCDLEVTCG